MDEIVHELGRRVQRLEDKHVDTTSAITRSNVLMERFTNSLDKIEVTLDKLNTTMDGVQISMVEMNSKITGNGMEITEVKNELTNIRGKVNVIDESGKINFIVLVKENFSKFIFGGGFVALIAYWIDHLIDTYKLFNK